MIISIPTVAQVVGGEGETALPRKVHAVQVWCPFHDTTLFTPYHTIQT